MAKKSSDTESPIHSSSNELEQLRFIVFGEAQLKIEKQIADLASNLSEQIQTLSINQNERIDKLQFDINKSIDELDNKINAVDRQHDDNNMKLVGVTEQLNSALETADNSSKDEAEVLHKRLNAEVESMTYSFNEKYALAMQKLEQVTRDLTDSKTDRKTLAKLLAAMAVNLESDEE